MVILAVISAPELAVEDWGALGSPMRIPRGRPGTEAALPVLALFSLPDSVIVGRPEPTVLPPGAAENSPRRLPAGCKGWSGAAGFKLNAITRPPPLAPFEEIDGGGGTAPAESS
jgi:hypothetical protein